MEVVNYSGKLIGRWDGMRLILILKCTERFNWKCYYPKIIKLIGKTSPSGFAYELFLDEKGEKISKSKGNGITIDQWLEYASPESLSLYMYQNPKRAKKLYKEIVPKTVDDYLDFLEKSKNQDELKLLMNPVWHVHNGEVPKEKTIMSFSMLLNLVETSNADSKDLYEICKKI